jgi:hypothetical protein
VDRAAVLARGQVAAELGPAGAVTVRLFAGTTDRPGADTTARPFAGITARP